MLKLTHDQAEKVDALVQELEEVYPDQTTLDVTIAIIGELNAIVCMEKEMLTIGDEEVI